MFSTRPEIKGTFGVVTSTHWLASATGMAALEKGGNAFDAAAAAGFVLQVVEPHQNGPGGEVPLILHDARRRKIEVICGQGTTPAAATIAAYRALGLEVIPGNGLLAAVVPGAFDAWMVLLRDYGTMSLREALSPAIAMAETGYAVVPEMADLIGGVAELFRTEWQSSAAIYLPHGRVPAPGSLFRNPALAQTYLRLLREAEAAGGGREAEIEAARRVWYRGFIAETIDRFCRTSEVMDSSGRRHRGLLTGDDMAGWKATIEAPATYEYGGYEVAKTGPWGQGPVMLQTLALLKGFDLAAASSEGPDFVHLVNECTKLAFADREAFYGDPDFVSVPLDHLLSDAYNAERRRLVGETASRDLMPGEVPGFAGRIIKRDKGSTDIAYPGAIPNPTAPRKVSPQGAARAVPAESGGHHGDTCHLDIIDRHGNMISATPSGGWLFGSPAIPELGWCLPTRGQIFWLEEGLPTSLRPRQRPRTTLSPGLVLRQGEPYMAFGTQGGDRQDQWSLHMLLRHLHFGLDLQQAIDAPEFFTAHAPSSFFPREWQPAHLAIEGRFPEATVAVLRERGHDVVVAEDWSLGSVTAATRDGPFLKAGASPRFMQAYAIGR